MDSRYQPFFIFKYIILQKSLTASCSLVSTMLKNKAQNRKRPLFIQGLSKMNIVNDAVETTLSKRENTSNEWRGFSVMIVAEIEHLEFPTL